MVPSPCHAGRLATQTAYLDTAPKGCILVLITSVPPLVFCNRGLVVDGLGG
jgi:hypothetical protein